MWFLVLSLFVSIIGSNAHTSDVPPQQKGQLKFVHILFRHGDRTPVDPYPTDPWNNLAYWPVSWGQLTNRGKMQQFELGQWLRNRYNELLGKHYNVSEIYVRATDVDRVIMSAQSNLAGLYVPSGTEVWKSDLLWQPIPVHTVPSEMDSLLAGTAPCKSYERALDELMKSEEFLALDQKYAALYEYLTKHTGREVRSLRDVHFLNNTLLIEMMNGMKLPDWTSKVYPSDDMTWISNFVFSINTYTRRLARLKSGPLLVDMLRRFEEKAAGKLNPDRNVHVYSAHDSTLANFLNTLKLFELHSPPYVACVLVEMRVNALNEPFVSIYYRNSSAEPQPLFIPNCGYDCSLKSLRRLYDDVLPQDWSNECKVSTLAQTYSEANTGQAAAILLCFMTLWLIICYTLHNYCRRRNYISMSEANLRI